MKIYFDGCSYTHGAELQNPEETRYSRILANKLGAEEYNFAINGGSNRRLVRNLIEKDLSSYDLFIIQLTKNIRTEYYNGNEWIRIKYPVKYMNSEKYKKGMNEFWEEYYETYYHEAYGRIDREICCHAIMNILHGRNYIFLDIDEIRKLVGKNKARNGHPNQVGHIVIAKDILKRHDII